MSSFWKPEREKESNMKKRESMIQIQEKEAGNGNCLWDSPDIRCNKYFKGAILNTFKKKSKGKELCMVTRSHQIKNVNKGIEIF